MEILSDGLFNSIPEPNFLNQIVTECIIWEREGDSTAGDLIGGMQWAEHIIIGSDNDRHVHIVPGVDLGGLVDEVMSVIEVLEQVILDFVEVAVGCPAVGIDDSDEDIVTVDHHPIELLFHVLDTPWDVGSFALLLVGSSLVASIVDWSELGAESCDQLLGFLVAVLLVFFHC